MEFLLFLFFLSISLFYLGAISYYSRILFLYPRDVYEREEIVSIGKAILQEIFQLFEATGHVGKGALAFLIGGLLPALWARFGGIVGSPHYTHSPGNYFFHFPFLFLAFSLSYGFWKLAYPPEITRYGYPLAIGLGAGSIAKSLSSYGIYHEMYFAFSLLVVVIVSVVASYLWNREKFLGLELPGYEESQFNEYDDVNESIDASQKSEDTEILEFEDPQTNWQSEQDTSPPLTQADLKSKSETSSDEDWLEFDPEKI